MARPGPLGGVVMARRRRTLATVRRRRILVVGLVTVIVLMTASGLYHGARSNAGFRSLVDHSFFRKASILAAQSGQLDDALTAVLVAGPSVARQPLQADLDGLDRTAQRVAAVAVSTLLPGPRGSAASALIRGLDERATGVADLRASIDGLLHLTSVPQPNVTAMPTQIAQLSQGDAAALLHDAAVAFSRAEQSFADATAALRRQSPRLSLEVPPWSKTEALLTPAGQASFLHALAVAPTLAAVHELSIRVVSLDPPALPLQSTSGTAVLLPTSTLGVGVVVANEGNVAEDPVAVVINVEPLDGSGVRQVTDHVSIAPGTSVAVQHDDLVVHPGHHYRLVISVLAPPADPIGTGVSRTISITVAAG